MSSTYKAIVIGTSMGGFAALRKLLPQLPVDFGMPVVIVQHIGSDTDDYWVHLLNKECVVTVKEADEKEQMLPGVVYTAPPNYHLLIETDETFSLAVTERVNHARPAIDVLFESASVVFGKQLMGILLTGASTDGALGMQAIKNQGGLTIAQDPATAEAPTMPASAIAKNVVDYSLPIDKIIHLVKSIDLNRNHKK